LLLIDKVSSTDMPLI